MGNLEFFYALNIILISRLGYVLRDKALKKKDLRYLIIFQFLSFLLLEFTWMTLLLLLIVVIINPVIYYLENQNRENLLKLIKLRIGFLLFYLLVFSFIFSDGLSPEFNIDILNTLEGWSFYFVIINWLSRLLWVDAQITLMGLLLIINEVNLLIRVYFQTFDLLPREEELSAIAPQPETQAEPTRAPVDVKEYNAGRVIGILERDTDLFFCALWSFCSDWICNRCQKLHPIQRT